MNSGGGGASLQNVNTKFTQQQINNMDRKSLETVAKAVAAKLSTRQGISESEAIRRANLLMSAQSDAQLRKYIKKNG